MSYTRTPKTLAQRRRQAQAKRQAWMARYDRCPLTAPLPQRLALYRRVQYWTAVYDALRAG